MPGSSAHICPTHVGILAVRGTACRRKPRRRGDRVGRSNWDGEATHAE